MSRKFKVTAVAILATLTFATTAFAGIFDVVGAVVGGVLGVTMQPTQEQLEKFHKDYLDKLANKIKQTGDVETAVADVITEQKKLGNVSTVQNDKGQVVSAEISGGNLPVTVKCSVDRQQQLMTISYVDSNGTSVGNTLTKKYELPGGTDTVATQVDNSTNTNLRNETNNVADVVGNGIVGSSKILPLIQKQIYSVPLKSDDPFYNTHSLSGFVDNRIGFPPFDNSLLRGNFNVAAAAFTESLREKSIIESYGGLNEIAKKSDPFAEAKLQEIYKATVNYYKQGHSFDGWELHTKDLYCPCDMEQVFNIKTQDKLDDFVYDTTCQKYSFTLWGTGAFKHSERYVICIPVAQAHALYKKLKAICDQNKANLQKIKMCNNKQNIRVPVTMIRICHAGDTKMGDLDYYNAHLTYKAVSGYMYGNRITVRYDFKGSKFKDLGTFSQAKAHKRYHALKGEFY